MNLKLMDLNVLGTRYNIVGTIQNFGGKPIPTTGEYLELYPPGGTNFLTRLGSRGVQVENVSLLCASNPCN